MAVIANNIVKKDFNFIIIKFINMGLYSISIDELSIYIRIKSSSSEKHLISKK